MCSTQTGWCLQVRIASQAVVVGNKLYVLAGWDPGAKQDGGDILSDIWALDLDSRQWEEVKPQVSSQL